MTPLASRGRSVRWLWIFMLVLLVAYGVRLLMFEHALPFIDEHDEPNFYLLANDWRGVLDAYWRNDWLAGYPPGYIWFYTGALDVIDGIFHPNIHVDMSLYIRLMRLSAIWFDMLTLSMVIVLGRLLAGRRAALLAGVIWALSNGVLDNAVRALPDGPTVMWCALCAVMGVLALRRMSWPLALGATCAALLGIVFKYAVFPILILPAVCFLVLLWVKRRRALIPAGIALLLVLSTAYSLLVVYGAAGLDNAEASQFRNDWFQNLTNPVRWQYLFNGIFGTLGPVLGLGALGAGLWMLLRRQRLSNWKIIGLVFLAAAAILVIIPAYLAGQPPRTYPIRYTWPGLVLLVPVCAAIIVKALSTKPRPNWLWGLALAVPVIGLLPGTPGTIAEVAEFRRPHAFTFTQAWFADTAPDGSVIWMDGAQTYVSLSRYDRGFYSYKVFDGLYGIEVVNWQDDLTGFDYVYLDQDGIDHWPRTSALPPLDDLPLLKATGGPGTAMEWVARIYSTTVVTDPQEISFQGASARLLLWAYVVSREDDTFTIDTFWQAPDAPPPADFSYSVYLTTQDDPGTVIQQSDAQLGLRRSSTWNDPDERIEGGIMPFMLPGDLPAGDYLLHLVVYDSATGERLALDNGETSLLLEEIQVE